ncbi:hypothetical protein BX616_001939 [Lobosporangium transversale]|uniref:Uncharacterized protein n=1 Tax=Lobosporangium transversale TaxID=64571 RepID=A0A1Y2GRY6_9FUNG|nr:hypothetical protein BCR41DRAFT_395266 [Lobosporangium transversale]KAF9902426.1 hypothetical protein BX616_001939 [Lobosporangium transversale]ORZ19130.1 hypothetical protein BCR41DRAFT_395266 [Lobosporangium transversale]|eukprot:XP_021882298.1 hypothetical protein BCR41DRAFT_395266 [Lobosporangium transversale]
MILHYQLSWAVKKSPSYVTCVPYSLKGQFLNSQLFGRPETRPRAFLLASPSNQHQRQQPQLMRPSEPALLHSAIPNHAGTDSGRYGRYWGLHTGSAHDWDSQALKVNDTGHHEGHWLYLNGRSNDGRGSFNAWQQSQRADMHAAIFKGERYGDLWKLLHLSSAPTKSWSHPLLRTLPTVEQFKLDLRNISNEGDDGTTGTSKFQHLFIGSLDYSCTD